MVSEVLSAMSALPASMLHSDAHSNQPHSPHSPHSPLPSPPDPVNDHNNKQQQPNNDNNSNATPHSSAASSPASIASSLSSSHLSPAHDDEDDGGLQNGHHQLSPAATHTPLPPISEDDTLTPMDTSAADVEPLSPTTTSGPSSPQPASTAFSPSSAGSDPSASKRKLTVEIPAASAAASSAVTPLPPLHPGTASATSRFDVWMTPAQARAESKRLKGYRWMLSQPLQPATAAPAGVIASREEKRVRKERKYDDELSTITTPTPAVKRERTGGQTPGGGRRQSGSSAAPTGSPVAQPPSSPYASFAPPTPRPVPPRGFKRQLSAPVLTVPSATGVSVRALELRLEALKQHQAMLLAQQGAASPAPAAAGKKRKSTSASFPSHDAKKARTPEFAVPASPSASPSFSSTFPSSTAAGSPTIHGQSPQLTRTGRSIRTPSHFSAVDPVTLSSDLRRAKHVVELLMAYKPAFGVFNTPVNFDDPTKPFYAAGYLEAIKGNKPMDLGTVKATLSEGGYDGLEEFAADVRQVWRNAQLFNPSEDWIHTVSKECERIFEQEMTRIMDMAQRETERKNKRAADREAAKLANPDAATPGAPPPASDEYGFPSSSLAEVPMQRASTGPPVRPKARMSMPSSSGGGVSGKEKQMLKDDIFKLPPHKLGPVVEIISKSSTSVAGDDDEIEIDIDKLDVATLRELQEYVKKALAPPPRAKTKPTGITAAGRRSTTPRHSPTGSILQSPPRLSTPEREANAPASPSVASVQSVSSVGASKPIRYESDESSDDESDDEGRKKALPPVVLPMADDNEVSE